MRHIFLFFFLWSKLSVFGQTLPLVPVAQGKSVPHINLALNRIVNGNMQAFYKKLAALKKDKPGVVNIVHIGDSHIQPDFITSVLRSHLQQFFGNSGRGLVFPYQVAKSNAPPDISSSSNISWEYNRLAHPEIPIECGIAGHVVKSRRPLAKINFSLKDNSDGPQLFTRVKFFLEKAVSTAWLFESDSIFMPSMLTHHNPDSVPYEMVTLENPVNNFRLISQTAGEYQSLYGISLENDQPGVRVHTIGVNGARYEHYNRQSLFWQQLPALEADLVIISLGTNEAQAGTFIENDFLSQVETFVNNIKDMFPGAAILITTPQDSYKGKGSNTVMRSLSASLAGYCQRNNIAIWDLYKVTNGFGSAKNWLKKGFLNHDRVHFTSPGYYLQGALLYNALAKGYNDYLKADQNFK